MLHADQINIMYSKTYTDDIYENKAYFVLMKNRKKPLFYELFFYSCKLLSLYNQNGLEMIHIDRLIRIHRVLIIFSVTT